MDDRYDTALLGDLPRGDLGTLETLALMRELVLDALQSEDVRTLAETIAAHAGGGPVETVAYLWSWLRGRVVFQRDPAGAELLRIPEQLIAEIAAAGVTYADCDDLSMLAAALIGRLGLRPAFVVVGRSADGRFEHVMAGVVLEGPRVIPLDSQEAAGPGQLPGGVARSLAYDVLSGQTLGPLV